MKLSHTSALQTICRCIAKPVQNDDFSTLEAKIGDKYFPWEPIIIIANAYYITPALWAGLVEKGLHTRVHEVPRNYMQTLHGFNIERNNQLKMEVLDAVKALNSVSITPLLLKGAAQFFRPIHSDIGARIMKDIDLYIPEEKYPIALKALKRIGHKEMGVSYDTTNLHHWAPLMREGSCGSIELHRHALHNETNHLLSMESILQDAELLNIDGKSFYLCSKTHSVLIDIIHSQVGDRYHGLHRFNLRCLHDLQAMAKTFAGEIDWRGIDNIMAMHKMDIVLETILHAANKMFDMPRPRPCRPGSRARLHHLISLSVVRCRLIARLLNRADDYSKMKIMRRFNCNDGALALTAYRIHNLIVYIKNQANLYFGQ